MAALGRMAAAARGRGRHSLRYSPSLPRSRSLSLPTFISPVFHLAASKILICTFDDRQSLKCVVVVVAADAGGRARAATTPPPRRSRRETREGMGCRRGGGREEGRWQTVAASEPGGVLLNSERVLHSLDLGRRKRRFNVYVRACTVRMFSF